MIFVVDDMLKQLCIICKKVDERVCMTTTVCKHDRARSKCPLLQVFKNALVVGWLGSGPASLVG